LIAFSDTPKDVGNAPSRMSIILQYLVIQLKTMKMLLADKNEGSGNYVLFFMCERNIIPILASKIFGHRRRIIVMMGGSSKKMAEIESSIFAKVSSLLEEVSLTAADDVVVYSGILIEEWGLQKHIDKITIASQHVIDLTQFKILTPFIGRKRLVGYVGRFSEEKEPILFFEAMKRITQLHGDIEAVMIGDGALLDGIRRENVALGGGCQIEILGWVNQDELPSWYNKMALLVIPSKTEGMPYVLLEAMACGTPVLSAKVGAVPDVISDGNTGFFISSTTAEGLADEILNCLSNSQLPLISNRAKLFVEETYSLNGSSQAFRSLFEPA